MKKWMAPMIFSFAAVLVSVFVYSQLPESMAIHFGAGGNPDNFASRPVGAFAVPVLIWIVTLLIVAGTKAERDESKRKRAESINQTVLAIISAMLLAVHLFTISYNLGLEISPIKFASVIVGIVFVLIGNLLPRMTQVKSLRRWPRLSEEAQRTYGRFQGRLMFVTGFVFILLALLPDPYLSPVFFVLLIMFVAANFISVIRLRGQTR